MPFALGGSAVGTRNGSRFGYIHNPRGKTEWAKHNVAMSARVQAPLSVRHEESGKPSEGWVFPGSSKAEHVPYSTIDSQYGRVIERLNEKGPHGEPPETPFTRFRIYNLRHTLLTRLGEAGADPFTVQRIAGHSSIVISQRYVLPTPERLEDAFARLEVYYRRQNRR